MEKGYYFVNNQGIEVKNYRKGGDFMRWSIMVKNPGKVEKVAKLIEEIGFVTDSIPVLPNIVQFIDFGSNSPIFADELRLFIEKAIDKPCGWNTIYGKILSKIGDKEILFLLENVEIYDSEKE